ncbi:MAG: hypothetical protein RR817_10365 [Niameybacter sp.]
MTKQRLETLCDALFQEVMHARGHDKFIEIVATSRRGTGVDE